MVSPKVNEQGDIRHKRIKVRALEMFAHLSRSGRAAFKVVCETEREVTEAAALLTAFRVPKEQSWVMPQGLTSKNVLRVAKTIEPAVVAHGLNLTLRQHVLLHEDKRGV
jgi:LytS/YehU family sensor histidine kinase